ncbi:MAG: L,D-transpeptidase family protein [Novosphingobium sp.]
MPASWAAPILLVAGCSSPASVDPSLPAWSKIQIESLRKLAFSGVEDALPQFSTAQLDAALDSGDENAIRLRALELAEQLASAHLHGCAGPDERAQWFMQDAADSANLRGKLVNALLGGAALDGFFAGLRPANPGYAALREAYLSESDPARRLTLARNMERWRWMPQALGADYVLVNVPAFEVYLMRQGTEAQTWHAVVGKTATPTPQLAATITGVTFNPWWDVPVSIAKGGHFSARGGYVITPGHVRQRPGPRNALGQMKVEMPNPYAIYLHDTPSKGLFGAATRAFSHGCVRVADPVSLAAKLLEGVRTRDDIDLLLSPDKRDEARGRISRPPPSPVTELSKDPQIKTTTIRLRGDLPVYIAYFTAALRPDGSIGFLPDIYGRDTRIIDPAKPDKVCYLGAVAAAQPGDLHKPGENGNQGDPGP